MATLLFLKIPLGPALRFRLFGSTCTDMAFTTLLGQLHLFFPLNKTLELLFGMLVKAAGAADTGNVVLALFFLLGNR